MVDSLKVGYTITTDALDTPYKKEEQQVSLLVSGYAYSAWDC